MFVVTSLCAYDYVIINNETFLIKIYIPSDIWYIQYTYLQIYVLCIQYNMVYTIYIHTFRYMHYAYIYRIYIYIYICILNTVYTHVHHNKHSDILVKLILRRSNVFIIDFLDFILSGCYFYIL